ncbi:Deoxyguanosinetriphosphate triphosphohydrolase protein [Heracleum sosnowskyi]|uniref:Deoxyguanosinetriphosphate triphosphohydrolase protein n=1 Tax=Heracleum sosnowskyi TaxID=360622 RepID=A0AAD8JCD1_9APIA|nr:Deoxyguanosinetriphosphate triphosphohydrolase protein [Heracleum sosnowskyi]
MPRPGPKPYECVRRAWHSDRHQPIRGSIIQQIFRVVNGKHSVVTKGNREWQEKLPIVVFKAEEIMYSKANSEVEYMDLETIWDRVNEAINIIIRRDESTETGDLLPPCVEAALNLGCVPVRASRSQRHNNPRTYLTPRTQDSASLPPKVLDSSTQGRIPTSRPLHCVNQIPTSRPLQCGDQSIEERPGTVNLSNSMLDSNRRAMQNNRSEPTSSSKFPAAYETFPSARKKQFIPTEANTSANVGHVYPLHSGTHFQPEVPWPGLKNSNNVIVGTPVYPLIEPVNRGRFQNLYPCQEDDNAFSRVTHVDTSNKQQEVFEQTECDLSLRLGLFSDPCLNRGKGLASDIDIAGLHSSHDRGQLLDLNSTQSKEYTFFPTERANDSLELSSSSRNFEGQVQSAEVANRKRSNVDDGQIFWQQEPTPNRFSGRMRWPGL